MGGLIFIFFDPAKYRRNWVGLMYILYLYPRSLFLPYGTPQFLTLKGCSITLGGGGGAWGPFLVGALRGSGAFYPNFITKLPTWPTMVSQGARPATIEFQQST